MQMFTQRGAADTERWVPQLIVANNGTISELGSLAEIIGSLAVLITLIVLVFQVRAHGSRLNAGTTSAITVRQILYSFVLRS